MNSMVQVYKFGGSSIKNAEGIRNLGRIVADADPTLVLVVSALGKTTNALEEIAQAYDNASNSWQGKLDTLWQFHASIASELFSEPGVFLDSILRPSFDALVRRLEKPLSGSFDFLYDQVVSLGEIWSTLLVHHYLVASGQDFYFVDIRDCLVTDTNYREGRVAWNPSGSRIRKAFHCTGKEKYITQGFIAGDGNSNTTTLGREGSDYTAAILANILEAQKVTVWKDVPGVMNADPEDYPHPVRLPEISYREAIELAFYGAKVIHPKTIKPLFDKNIPLRVKSFKDPSGQGTLIHEMDHSPQPIPVFVRKHNQVLVSVLPRDLSFVIDEGLGGIFSRIDSHKVKVNLIQNSAVSISLCVDRFNGRVEGLIDALSSNFQVLYNTNVELITIRHYTDDAIREMISGKSVLIEQKTRTTANYVIKTD